MMVIFLLPGFLEVPEHIPNSRACWVSISRGWGWLAGTCSLQNPEWNPGTLELWNPGTLEPWNLEP